jgi:hypothetical protein
MAYPDEKPKDPWDKAEILAKILGAVLLPVITICIAYLLNASIKDRSARVRTVELAVEILKSDPKAPTNANYVRGWAVEVLQKNSEVPLPEEALEIANGVASAHKREAATLGEQIDFPSRNAVHEKEAKRGRVPESLLR